MCIFHYFSYYLPDFVIAIHLGCVLFLALGCIFLIPFNAIKNHLWNLHSLARDQALSTDSKTRGYCRTPNPREYELVRTPTVATTYIQDPASSNCQQHPVQEALIQTTNKIKMQTQLLADSITTSHSPAYQRKKNSPPLIRRYTLQEVYIAHWTNLTRAEPKGRQNSTLKPGKRRPQTQ